MESTSLRKLIQIVMWLIQNWYEDEVNSTVTAQLTWERGHKKTWEAKKMLIKQEAEMSTMESYLILLLNQVT